MGCVCTRETININGIKYTVKERLGEGLVVFDIALWQLLVYYCVFRGFSSVDLVECSSSRKKYALKRIICHSADDQKLALREIDYYKKFKHPNIIELVDSTFKGSKTIVIVNLAYITVPNSRLCRYSGKRNVRSTFSTSLLQNGHFTRLSRPQSDPQAISRCKRSLTDILRNLQCRRVHARFQTGSDRAQRLKNVQCLPYRRFEPCNNGFRISGAGQSPDLRGAGCTEVAGCRCGTLLDVL